jgi:hypothetical protein
MHKSSVESIVRAMEAAGVRYLIAGGLAVVAHGVVRFTADVDLILAIDPVNLSRAITALGALGYQPRAPVPITDFLDPARRHEWATQKNMTVFSLFSPQHSATEVDLFLDPPLDFEKAYARAARLEISPGLTAAFCGVDDLIAMKEKVARPQDLADVAELRRLKGTTP